ncbi:uncharacterized protein LOC122027759 [Zingiber officinale]|uniref:uncharacterized protein LOC122027759 n=1 Tax=Zingiber officinale TaxID=94328 RepID=UPI001C4A9EF6|nr:uncharacterized protein LOC122027759 [Zingiber officinale]
MMRSLQGRLEILVVSVHMEGDAQVDQYDTEEFMPRSTKEPAAVTQLGERLHEQEISTGNGHGEGQAKQNRCSACGVAFGDAKQYREHFKSDWHKHNLKRKTRQLPPLTAEECLVDLELGDSKADLKGDAVPEELFYESFDELFEGRWIVSNKADYQDLEMTNKKHEGLGNLQALIHQWFGISRNLAISN